MSFSIYLHLFDFDVGCRVAGSLSFSLVSFSLLVSGVEEVGGGVGGDIDGGAVEAEEDEGAILMHLSGEWLVAEVVCIRQ